MIAIGGGAGPLMRVPGTDWGVLGLVITVALMALAVVITTLLSDWRQRRARAAEGRREMREAPTVPRAA